jgi:predicted O-methyltransferase YrrM
MSGEAPDSPAAAWNERYESTPALWSRNPNAALVELASELPPGRALDIGAGEGRNSVWLATRGWRVTALDVSDVALARAAERAAAEGVQLECVVADWREHELAQASLELVVVSYMHPDRHERPSMFGRAARALVPGGHLFVTGVHAVDHGRRGPPDRDRLHTPELLREALHDLEVVRCETMSYERERADGRQTVTDVVAVARAVADAGADGLSMINTLLGLVIDPDTMRPVLGGVTGGLSGPAIRPVALRCVWQVHQALPDVPILGMGGIRSGLDALQFVLAGASAVSVGTAVFNDPSAPARIHDELAAALAARGFASLAEAVGYAHRAAGEEL